MGHRIIDLETSRKIASSAAAAAGRHLSQESSTPTHSRHNIGAEYSGRERSQPVSCSWRIEKNSNTTSFLSDKLIRDMDCSDVHYVSIFFFGRLSVWQSGLDQTRRPKQRSVSWPPRKSDFAGIICRSFAAIGSRFFPPTNNYKCNCSVSSCLLWRVW